MKSGRDERGFRNFSEFKTLWHGKVRVKESSAAFRGPCVWIFAEIAYSNEPRKHPPHLHLQYKDAVALRDALNRFLAGVKDSETTEPRATGWGDPCGKGDCEV